MSRFYSILFFLILLSALPAGAQKLAIRNFEARPQDMDAQSNTLERRDRNGRRAALIKIYTSLPASELTFGGSAEGFVAQEQHGPGQVWLYVPRGSMKFTVSHPKYDPEPFSYPMEIKEGRVYSMIISPEGKEVSLSASARNAGIWIDGDSIGVSPVNTYIPYGTHAVHARLGSLLYDDDIVVSRQGPSQFSLKLEDEDLKYGDVVVDVGGGAELWFQGRREGVGQYAAHLRGGDYVIEARKADHEPATTNFSVVPGQVTHIQANAPTPHLGYLSLTTVPEHGVTVTEADTVIHVEREMQLPVANYEWTFSRRGYTPVTRYFHISRGETLADTIILRKIQYVPRTTGYVSVGFTAASRCGVAFTVGGIYKGIDLSLSYMLGLGYTKRVNWYDTDNILDQSATYRVDEFGVRAGYVLRFAERFGLTPQIGYVQQRLFAKDHAGNGFTVNCISIGARLTWYPVPHLGIFVTPEYDIPAGNKGDIKKVCSLAGMTRGGFHATAGLSLNL